VSRSLKTYAAAVTAIAPLLLASVLPTAAEDLDIPQIGAVAGGVSTILQNGDRNAASVNQLAVQSGLVPGQNHALISQTGDDNSASILQEGSANAAAIVQNGSNNAGTIIQQTSGSNVDLQQSGNGLSIKIEQYGAVAPGSPPIVITQGN
jgi:minor curlin subunit